MILYHRTDTHAAVEIVASRTWRSKENTGDVFFSNRIDGQAVGFGDLVLRVRVPKALVDLDDEFPDGEKHFRVRAANLTGRPVAIVAAPPG